MKKRLAKIILDNYKHVIFFFSLIVAFLLFNYQEVYVYAQEVFVSYPGEFYIVKGELLRTNPYHLERLAHWITLRFPEVTKPEAIKIMQNYPGNIPMEIHMNGPKVFFNHLKDFCETQIKNIKISTILPVIDLNSADPNDPNVVAKASMWVSKHPFLFCGGVIVGAVIIETIKRFFF